MHPTNTVASSPDYSPLGLLLNAYDQVISACQARNTPRAHRTILTLREAHPCDSPSAAGIDGLYAYCERAVLTGDFSGAARTLEQLRSAWQAADTIMSVPTEMVHRPAQFAVLASWTSEPSLNAPQASSAR